MSFEYIIVAACIIGAVAAAFGTGGWWRYRDRADCRDHQGRGRFPRWPPDTAVWAQRGHRPVPHLFLPNDGCEVRNLSS